MLGEVDHYADLEAERSHILDQSPVEHLAFRDAERGGPFEPAGQEVVDGRQRPAVQIDDAEEIDGHGGSFGG